MNSPTQSQNTDTIRPVILAGGSGTRLWPLSRELYPKQLLALTGEMTMLQETIHRLSGVERCASPIIICNENHRFMVAEQLRTREIEPEALILEPVGRNTAPAVAVAALHALAKGDDPILLVLPADHFIRNISAFHLALEAGLALARKDLFITFGIPPESPETGYGYIHKGKPVIDMPGRTTDNGAFFVDKFVEKPNEATAAAYVKSGEYCWNSGMFMFRASGVLAEIERFRSDMVGACRRAREKGSSDLDFFRLDRTEFEACPSDSIDYAVMEKTDKGVMIVLQTGWSDLGSWEALWHVGAKDPHANVVHGDVLIHDVRHSYLHAGSRLLAAVGLEHHIVVETADAVLISPRNKVQEVRKLVEKLKAANRTETITHKKRYAPWGWSELLVRSDRFEVRRVMVKPGESLALQKHFNRAEHWIVLKGAALVIKGNEEIFLHEDRSTYIPPGVTHRLENPGKIALEIIEVRSGSYLGEDDVVRMEQLYADDEPITSSNPYNTLS